MDKQELKQYHWLRAELDRLQAEHDDLISGSVGAVWLDSLPKGSGDGDTTGNITAKMWTISQTMAERMNELVELRQRIEDTINSLPDSRDRLLLRLRYIEGKSWEEIAVEMHYDYRYVLKLHGRVLQRLRAIGH